ncbi:MAG TPA: hypothetical protein VHF69_09875 [Candidatus Synoicihabitans sp.]|nr:hypothetical protein [Candidatus Synoicihabitans sp.]
MRMRLIVGSKNLAVAKVGPDFIVLKEPAHLKPSHAELVVEIDGIEDRSSIFLPDGVSASDERTRIAHA